MPDYSQLSINVPLYLNHAIADNVSSCFHRQKRTKFDVHMYMNKSNENKAGTGNACCALWMKNFFPMAITIWHILPQSRSKSWCNAHFARDL
jgi:hypothetical protein